MRTTAKITGVLLALLTVLLLAACGDDSDDEPAGSEAAPAATSGEAAAPASSGATTAEAPPATEAAAPAESEAAESTDGPWTYTDDAGKTVELEKRPTRIIAHAYAAAALMEFGIKPIAIYADTAIDEDVGLKGVDFTGVEIIGEEWGKIDVEKAAALKPDLIVADWWPVEKAYSGMEDGVEERSKKIGELAPVVGAAQGDSIVTLIEGYVRLAEALGADVEDGPAAKAKAEFEAARDAFTAAVEAKPGLTALAISPYDDIYAVAVPEHAPELLDLQRWGLNVIVPDTPDPDFPYWQSLSFEKADTYQPDLLLFDDRNYPGNLELLEKQPIAKSIRSFARGQHTTWPAYWLHTYGQYAEQLRRLTEVIEGIDPNVGD